MDRFQRQLEEFFLATRVEVDRDVPVDQRMFLDYGGTLSFAFIALDDSQQKTHILRQSTLTAYLHANIDGAHDFLLRGRTSYRDFNSGDAFDKHGDDWIEPTLDRGIYTFNLQRYLSAYEGRRINGNLVIEAGRQLVHWANGLVLSQDLDGVQVTGSYGPLSLLALAATTRDSNNDFDTSRPSYDHDTHRDFFGGMLTYRLSPRHRPFVYGLVQRDRNKDEVLTTAGSVGDIDTRFNYDSWYVGAGARGNVTDRLLYAIEFAYQGGEGLSNSFDPATGIAVMQTEEDIRAWALNARLDYVIPGDNRTRLNLELILASGDDDRGHTSNTFDGNAPGTDDTAFNGFGYLDTGLAFAPNVSNLMLIRAGAATYPMPRSPLFGRAQVGGNLLLYNKLDADAPINEATSNHHYLGTGAEVFLNWQITSDVTIAARYGVFFPGEAIETDHDERHFFFTGVTYAF